ncbi:MAG: YgiT-type zinc finger protein [Anaerolineales bacterium]|nr:YgiT-type zinc finger protein [Anaerolineales bacterium]
MSHHRSEGESAEERVSCTECLGGFLEYHKQPFIYWTGKELINIPNFPARRCDICGWREYDPQATFWFYKIYGRPVDDGSGKPGLGSDDLHGPIRRPTD